MSDQTSSLDDVEEGDDFVVNLGDKLRMVRFHFNGELILQQPLKGRVGFTLSGLVPNTAGELVFSLDGEQLLAWDLKG